MGCIFCGREINNTGSLTAHQNVCKENPEAVKYKRSPKAGLQKGNIPWNVGKKIGRHKSWDEKFPDSVIFNENSTYPRHCLKARIIERELIRYNCACCGIEPMWQGKPMPLILDHINGVNNDNRLENLRFVCSNCDTQLPTYKSKNKNNGR